MKVTWTHIIIFIKYWLRSWETRLIICSSFIIAIFVFINLRLWLEYLEFFLEILLPIIFSLSMAIYWTLIFFFILNSSSSLEGSSLFSLFLLLFSNCFRESFISLTLKVRVGFFFIIYILLLLNIFFIPLCIRSI